MVPSHRPLLEGKGGMSRRLGALSWWLPSSSISSLSFLVGGVPSTAAVAQHRRTTSVRTYLSRARWAHIVSGLEAKAQQGGGNDDNDTSPDDHAAPPTLLDRLQEGVGLQFVRAHVCSPARGSSPTPTPSDLCNNFHATLAPVADSSSHSRRDRIQRWGSGGGGGNPKGLDSTFLYAVLDNGKHPLATDDDYQRSIWICPGARGRLLGETEHRQARKKDGNEVRWYLEFRDPVSRRLTRLYYHDPDRNHNPANSLRFCLSRAQLADHLRSLEAVDTKVVVGDHRPAPSSSGADDDGGGSTSAADVPSTSEIPPDATPAEQLWSGLRDVSWRDALRNDAVASDSLARLADFLDDERQRGNVVYPPQSQIFEALNACPIENVRVVIVGQDPYHGPGQAHGLAFSVSPGVPPPPSLRNVLRELANDIGDLGDLSDDESPAPRHGCLTGWAQQGVLLLNDVLTVRQGEAGSHARQGWEDFTNAVLHVLLQRNNDRPLVWLLWGNPAQKKAGVIDETRHIVIRTSHPSPLGATKTSSPFLGSKCFSRANAALIELGHDPINWNRR